MRPLLQGIALGTLPAIVLGVMALQGSEEPNVWVRAADAAYVLPAVSVLPPTQPVFEAGHLAPASVVTAEVVPLPPLPPIQLRIVEPVPIEVTTGELYQGLARSPWPRSLWQEVVRIARCEARYGAGVDVRAEGDGGRALGILQVRVDAHPDLARDYALLTLDGALAAAWLVYTRAGGFSPWSCAS